MKYLSNIFWYLRNDIQSQAGCHIVDLLSYGVQNNNFPLRSYLNIKHAKKMIKLPPLTYDMGRKLKFTSIVRKPNNFHLCKFFKHETHRENNKNLPTHRYDINRKLNFSSMIEYLFSKTCNVTTRKSFKKITILTNTIMNIDWVYSIYESLRIYEYLWNFP